MKLKLIQMTLARRSIYLRNKGLSLKPKYMLDKSGIKKASIKDTLNL